MKVYLQIIYKPLNCIFLMMASSEPKQARESVMSSNNLYVSTYVCMYVCMYVCVYVYIYICVCVYIYLYICIA